MTGRTIAHYEIVAKLGEGGMGVVYKARDTHLDRFVAIKFLPPEKVADPGRKQRFIHEAKAASALSHPNIIHIYDIGQAGGLDFISMEFVCGKTLDRLIPRHGMQVSEVLKYAVQIAGALSTAHSAGIIHRDLKPGNVIVTDQELVKVLDFGLAKLTGAAPGGEEDATRTLRPPVTEEGTIVGTVAYMSPEQAEGKELDQRSDIFSFGSVLYEMLTGRRPFRGDTRAATIAAILLEEPKPPSQIVEGLPREVDRIVKCCLRKDPSRRVQHMDDIKGMLQDVKEESEIGQLEVAAPPKPKRRRAWALAILAAVVIAAGIGALIFERQSAAPPPEAVPLTTDPGWAADPSFSPEGTRVVFSWNGNVYVKLIGGGAPLPLTTHPGDDFSPAWSPDGTTIAFLRTQGDRLELLSIPSLGGAPERKLGELDLATDYRGYPNRELAWSPDSSSLVFFDKPAGEPPGLFLLSIATRQRRRLTSLPATLLRDSDPAFSPDGRTLAFIRIFTYSFSHLYLLPLSPDLRPIGEQSRLARKLPLISQPAWTSDGRKIVVSSDGGLWRAAVSGSGSPERLPFPGDHIEQLDISRQGQRLVYNTASSNSNIWRVPLKSLTEAAPPANFIASTRTDTNPQYSPDGQRVVFASDRSGKFEIWECKADGSSLTQLTNLRATESGSPRWFPDGRHVVFDSDKKGNFDIYVIGAEGGEVRPLTSHPDDDATPSVSNDGKTIYFSSRRTGPWEIWRMPSGGGAPVQVTRHGGFSPFEDATGDFVYYAKNKGRFSELWRVPAGGGEETQVLPSVGGLRFAVRREGIYFIEWPNFQSDASLRFLSFATGKTKNISKIQGRPFLNYDLGLTVSPDGRSILYTHPDHPNSDLMLVENFR